MKFVITHILILFLTFLGFMIYPAGNAFSQNILPGNGQNFGNVLLMNENHFKNGNVTQKGFFNTMIAWPHPDSLHHYGPAIEGSQSGVLNQAVIFSMRNAQPFSAQIDQQGVRNRMIILQGAGNQYTSKDDSTVTKKNSVTIRQKGNNNRATIIQN